VTLRSSGDFTCAHHVINTGPLVRTVLVDGGVPFTSATWVIAVVRFAPDSRVDDWSMRMPRWQQVMRWTAPHKASRCR